MLIKAFEEEKSHGEFRSSKKRTTSKVKTFN